MLPPPAWRADPTLGSFAGRVLVVLLLGALALAAWRLADLILLLFAAVLMAVGLRAAARSLTRVTGIGNAAGLGVVVVLFVAALGLALWFFGSMVVDQLDEVVQQVPAGVRVLLDRVQAHPYGRYALEQARGVSTTGATAWAASALAAIGGALARGFGYAVLTFFAAIYLAAQPELYRRLCVRLTPPSHRPRTEQLFDETADVLRRWLVGQLVVMLTIGVLSGIGLWALGIEAAFALGVVGGLLTFIPMSARCSPPSPRPWWPSRRDPSRRSRSC